MTRAGGWRAVHRLGISGPPRRTPGRAARPIRESGSGDRGDAAAVGQPVKHQGGAAERVRESTPDRVAVGGVGEGSSWKGGRGWLLGPPCGRPRPRADTVTAPSVVARVSFARVFPALAFPAPAFWPPAPASPPSHRTFLGARNHPIARMREKGPGDTQRRRDQRRRREDWELFAGAEPAHAQCHWTCPCPWAARPPPSWAQRPTPSGPAAVGAHPPISPPLPLGPPPLPYPSPPPFFSPGPPGRGPSRPSLPYSRGGDLPRGPPPGRRPPPYDQERGPPPPGPPPHPKPPPPPYDHDAYGHPSQPGLPYADRGYRRPPPSGPPPYDRGYSHSPPSGPPPHYDDYRRPHSPGRRPPPPEYEAAGGGGYTRPPPPPPYRPSDRRGG